MPPSGISGIPRWLQGLVFFDLVARSRADVVPASLINACVTAGASGFSTGFIAGALAWTWRNSPVKSGRLAAVTHVSTRSGATVPLPSVLVAVFAS